MQMIKKAVCLYSEPQCRATVSGVPGENLPERHFKKKYFNEEFQKQQAHLAANY
jgi:hypothetical protein